MSDPIINKNTLKDYLRNPLGIIALFATICYMIAGLVFSIGLDKLNGPGERLPFIWFIIIFPVVLFAVFVVLVWFHHEKLYSPSDFKDEANFVKLTQQERERKYREEAVEMSMSETATAQINNDGINEVLKKERENLPTYIYSAQNSAHLAIQKLSQMYGISFTEEVRYGKYVFDAIGSDNGETYIVECKYFRNIIHVSRLHAIYKQVMDYRQALANKNPHIILVYILEQYTSAKSDKILEFYKSLGLDIDIKVFDYADLRNTFSSIPKGKGQK